MPKTKVEERSKYRVMLTSGPADNRITDIECNAGKPPKLLFVPIPPADIAETEAECQWQVGSYRFKNDVDFELLGVHYVYEWVGIIE